MKIIYLLCAIALLISGGLGAQENSFPPAFVIESDTSTIVTLGTRNFQLLAYPSDDITLEDILDKISDKNFVYYNDTLIVREAKGSAWLRYKIKNDLAYDLNITFLEQYRQSNVYVKNAKEKWQHFKTGYRLPWSQRDGIKKNYHIPYTIKPGEEITIYKKIVWSDLNEINPVIGFFDKVAVDIIDNDDSQIDTVFSSALFGFMAFAAMFNFFFYYIIRERVYLFYAITLVLTALFNISDTLFDLFFKEHPATAQNVLAFSILAIMMMVIFTMRLFLNIKKSYPKWDKVLLAFPLVLVGFVAITKFTLSNRYFGAILNYVGFGIILFYIIGILIMLVMYLIRKDKNARLITIALIPFFLSALLSFDESIEWLSVLGLIWAIGVISWSLFARFRDLMAENNRQALEKERLAREKEEERNELIARQNQVLEQQVAARTRELSDSLESLKTTQNQLIQSEKMASLGELTAGIAHEIQNPLNFVNNFSDVSIELLDEMGEELDKGDTDEAKAIAGDIKQNLEKIAHHGKRADSIVKGMLQHSRASSGQKEPTDINALADEYLRLAYHGLRAKDKSFNAELATNFDGALQKVNVVPQDLGRVLLNLFTNAFYSTAQKQQAADGNYKPSVSVTSIQKDDIIEIIVKDNGTGIPVNIKDKILQPFFTTKPTGEGTGLGLSLSYDIVVKGHGGKINIESTEGEGAVFIIQLPIKS